MHVARRIEFLKINEYKIMILFLFSQQIMREIYMSIRFIAVFQCLRYSMIQSLILLQSARTLEQKKGCVSEETNVIKQYFQNDEYSS